MGEGAGDREIPRVHSRLIFGHEEMSSAKMARTLIELSKSLQRGILASRTVTLSVEGCLLVVAGRAEACCVQRRQQKCESSSGMCFRSDSSPVREGEGPGQCELANAFARCLGRGDDRSPECEVSASRLWDARTGKGGDCQDRGIVILRTGCFDQRMKSLEPADERSLRCCIISVFDFDVYVVCKRFPWSQSVRPELGISCQGGL